MSKKSSASSLETVASLLGERQKYEQWIAALHARRASTPDAVFARVHADYSARLQRVTEELHEHADELGAQADKLSGRLTELAESEQQRRDERAEAELRAHVGELTPEQWEATAKQADDELAALAADQAVVAADLTRVHELLGAATGPAAQEPVAAASPMPAAPTPEPAAEAAPEQASQAPAARASGATQQPPAAPPPPPVAPSLKTPARASRFDELAFLQSVVSPIASPSVKPKDDAPKPAAAGASAEPILVEPDNAADATSLVSRANRPSVAREFVREDDSPGAGGLVPRAKEPRRSVERPFAANVTGNHPIVLRPSGAIEQPKTLKCGECGAMNYPTEWYCERCGAELASL